MLLKKTKKIVTISLEHKFDTLVPQSETQTVHRAPVGRSQTPNRGELQWQFDYTK